MKVGDKTTVLCVVESKLPLNFSWQKNGKKLPEDEVLRFKSDEEFSILIIDPVRVKDSGNYTCHAKNSLGSDAFTAELVVEGDNFYLI